MKLLRESRLRISGPLLFACLFLFFMPAVVPPAICQSSADCLVCHNVRSLSMKKRGQTVSLYVDGARMKESVHAPIACVDCHIGFKPGEIPHAKVIKPVQCQACHEIGGFEKSVHGMSPVMAPKAKTSAAGCKACHGTHEIRSPKDPKSAVNKLNVSGSCAKCHKQEYQELLASAHRPLPIAGVNRSPSCVDCHGAHNISPMESSESPLFKTKEAKVCLKCHLDDSAVRKQVGTSAGFIASYQTSVHGVALASGNQKAATCSDCHGSHDLKKASDPSSRVSKWNIAETCSRCHYDIAKTYSASIHGTARQKGNAESPTCTDCHGEHQIYAPSDPLCRRTDHIQNCRSGLIHISCQMISH